MHAFRTAFQAGLTSPLLPSRALSIRRGNVMPEGVHLLHGLPAANQPHTRKEGVIKGEIVGRGRGPARSTRAAPTPSKQASKQASRSRRRPPPAHRRRRLGPRFLRLAGGPEPSCRLTGGHPVSFSPNTPVSRVASRGLNTGGNLSSPCRGCGSCGGCRHRRLPLPSLRVNATAPRTNQPHEVGDGGHRNVRLDIRCGRKRGPSSKGGTCGGTPISGPLVEARE